VNSFLFIYIYEDPTVGVFALFLELFLGGMLILGDPLLYAYIAGFLFIEEFFFDSELYLDNLL